MTEDVRRHLKTLGLEPGASVAEIKQAYRELAHIWHPDCFANAPQLRDMAQAKMAEINTAYQFLKRAIPESGSPSSPASGHAPAYNPPASPASPANPYTPNNRRGDDKPQSAQSAQSASSARSSRPTDTNAARDTARASPRNTTTSSGGNSHAPNAPLLAVVHALHDPFQPVNDVAFSPDGEWILAASGSSVFWWSVETGQMQRELRMEKGECPCLSVAPGGRSVAVANNLTGWLGRWRSELRVCDLQTGAEQRRIKQDGHVTSLGWSLDSKQIASGNTNGIARFWEADNGREIQHLLPDENIEDGQARRVAYVDGSYAAKQVLVLRTGQALSEIGLWEVRRARLLKAYSLHIRECLTYGQIGDVLPSPDGSLLLVANNDPGNRNYFLHLWDVKTGAEVRRLRGHDSDIRGLAWSADGRRVASCGADKTARVWDVASGTELARALGHTRAVRAVAFAPDGKLLATGGDDRAVCLWRLPS